MEEETERESVWVRERDGKGERKSVCEWEREKPLTFGFRRYRKIYLSIKAISNEDFLCVATLDFEHWSAPPSSSTYVFG